MVPTQTKDLARVLSVALLVAGNAVGAGILGLPVIAGLCGALPATLAMVFVWGIMLATSWILADEFTGRRRSNEDIPSLFKARLGWIGKWVAPAAYMVLLYCVLAAYLAGAGTVLEFLFQAPKAGDLFIPGFGLVGMCIVLFGLTLLRRCNAALMLLMAITFAVILGQCALHISPGRLMQRDWVFLPHVLPIMACAFAFHNIIPVAEKSLSGQRDLLKSALVLGSLFPLILGVLWIIAAIGVLPRDPNGGPSLLASFQSGQPATVPIADVLHSSLVTFSGMVFSLLAILTSFLGVSVSLLHLFQGFLPSLLSQKNKQTLPALLTIAPPLVVALCFSDIFLKALDLAGGLAIALIFGVFPALMWVRKGETGSPGRRLAGVLLLIAFTCIILLELFQKLGLLTISAQASHWTLKLP